MNLHIKLLRRGYPVLGAAGTLWLSMPGWALAAADSATSNAESVGNAIGATILTIVLVGVGNAGLGILLTPLWIWLYNRHKQQLSHPELAAGLNKKQTELQPASIQQNIKQFVNRFLDKKQPNSDSLSLKGNVRSGPHILLKLHNENLAGLYEIEQELTPLKKMSGGTSEDFLKEVDDKYSKLLDRVTADSGIFQNYKPGWIRLGSKWNQYKAAAERAAIYSGEIKDVKMALDRYRDLEEGVTVQMRSLVTEWEHTSGLLDALTNSTGSSYPSLREKGQQIKSKFETKQESLAFDPLAAQKFSNDLERELAGWKQTVESLFTLKQKSSELPGLLTTARKKLKEIVEREDLLLTEENLLKYVDPEDNRITRLESLIERAEVAKGQELLKQLEDDRALALKILEDTLAARKWVSDKLPEAHAQLSGNAALSGLLEQCLAELKAVYTPEHWHEEQRLYLKYLQNVRDLSGQLAEVDKNVSSNVQKYLAAKEQLEDIYAHLKENIQAAEQIQALKPKLDQQFTEDQDQLAALQKQYNLIRQAAIEEGVIEADIIQKAGQSADQALSAAAQVLAADLRSLNEAHSMLLQAEKCVNRLEENFHEFVTERNEVEYLLESLERSYKRMRGNLGWVKAADYSDDFEGIMNFARNAFDHMDFNRVRSYIDKGDDLIAEMEAEYEEIQEERRRRQG